jgi:flagellin
VASISGTTLTVDGTAAAAGNLVLSLDSGPDITVNLDGSEDAAGVATKIETAVNTAIPASSGQVATANSDGTVVFDFTNAPQTPAVSISGNILTIDPDAVGRGGFFNIEPDVGGWINVTIDGEPSVDAIAAKIVTEVNNAIPSTSGNIATANSDGTVTFDFTYASGGGYDGVSSVSIASNISIPPGPAASSVQINDTDTTVAQAVAAGNSDSASSDVSDSDSSSGSDGSSNATSGSASSDATSDSASSASDSNSAADNARAAITLIDGAIQKVNIQRSNLVAVSNRISHTINNLTNISSNLSAAQGGIEDADFAKETTDLAKNQILQQASTAMLAQANASKQNVLSLLQG